MLIKCGSSLKTRFLTRLGFFTGIWFILLLIATFILPPMGQLVGHILMAMLFLGSAIITFKLGQEWNQPRAADEDRKLIKQCQLVLLIFLVCRFAPRLPLSRKSFDPFDLVYVVVLYGVFVYLPFFLGRFIYQRRQERNQVPPNM
jgi:hypothetical protein